MKKFLLKILANQDYRIHQNQVKEDQRGESNGKKR
jgi:hypothetical protein